MTSAHILYIPMAVTVGIFLGFILGAKAARNAFDLEQRRTAEREAARAARAARRATADTGAAPGAAGETTGAAAGPVPSDPGPR